MHEGPGIQKLLPSFWGTQKFECGRLMVLAFLSVFKFLSNRQACDSHSYPHLPHEADFYSEDRLYVFEEFGINTASSGWMHQHLMSNFSTWHMSTCIQFQDVSFTDPLNQLKGKALLACQEIFLSDEIFQYTIFCKGYLAYSILCCADIHRFGSAQQILPLLSSHVARRATEPM